jgi:AraC-like DNA-binding protein
VKDSVRFRAHLIAGIQAMTASTARSYPRHTHDQYGIGVVDAGGHASWSDRGQVEAGPGSLICVNPGEVHDGRAVGRGWRTWRLLYIEPETMRAECADALDEAAGTFVFGSPVFSDERVRRLFDAAFTARGRMAAETAFLTLVAHLRAHSTLAPRASREPAPCIRRARDRIDADPSSQLTLAQLAREARVSRYQLIRGFVRELGLTPHAYIVQQRLALVRRLLRARRPAAEAALLAGFCDQSHMTRCFVRQFGVPPGRYSSSL